MIDRGPPDDIDMQLDCAGDGVSRTTTVLSGQTIRASVSDLSLPTELECTLTFTPRDPLAAPVFIQWLTSFEVGYGGKDRDAGVHVLVDVMASEP